MVIDWFRKLAARSPHPPVPVEEPREFDLLLAAERDEILASHLNAPLAALGFGQVAPRRWVDGSAAPIRRVFEMNLLKGAGIIPNWGFSLDFVPHVSGRRICWHRSDRTAMLDVIVDPKGPYATNFIRGAEWLHRDLDRLLPNTIERARRTWQQGTTQPGLFDILRDIREQNTNRFRFNFYWRMPLALIFLLAKSGDLGGALTELDAYKPTVKPLHDAEVRGKLVKLLRDIAAG